MKRHASQEIPERQSRLGSAGQIASAPPDPVCARFQNHLFAYLDGELPSLRAREVKEHLEHCAYCRGNLAQMRRAETALRAAASTLPSAGDLRPEFYARLVAEKPARRGYDWKLALPALAACALFTAFFSHSYLNARHAPDSLRSIPPSKPGAAVPVPGAAVPVSSTVQPIHPPAVTRPLLANAFRSRQDEVSFAIRPPVPARLKTETLPVLRAHIAPPAALLATAAVAQQIDLLQIHGDELVSSNKLADSAEAQVALSYQQRGFQSVGSIASSKAADSELSEAEFIDTSFSLHVHDEVRGFTASMNGFSSASNPDGAQIVIIRAEESGLEDPASNP